MGSGRSAVGGAMGGLGVPGGGIANLAPGMSPGMGGRFPTMGTPTPPSMTQQQMRQVLLDQQRTQQIPQMPGGQFGMPGGQMATPFPGAPGQMPPTQFGMPGGQFGMPTVGQQQVQIPSMTMSLPSSFLGASQQQTQSQMALPGQRSSMGRFPGSMAQAAMGLPQAVARPGGIPPNQPQASAGQGLGSIFGGMK
ncbi:hypothetical protein UFOVP330_72 [uncultured Caudovirales phage]|uniref:Uncharacterized protein n=1 Tax=uncultured Caudovirales phage TaxID=2100421 RepID=A0A6J5LZE4_9CAUD|nr:hypothetical protein UFOVP330_72 [uncultured Caudovirales phage]